MTWIIVYGKLIKKSVKKSELIHLWQELWLEKHDIEWVILHHLDISKEAYFLVDEVDKYEEILRDFERVWGWYPIQYITSLCEFYGRDFYVDSRVLIPRIDTELMIDIIIVQKYSAETQYVDVGTGSGIIPITLALELWSRDTKIYALELSKDAIKVAKKNLERHWICSQVKILQSDLLDSIGKFSLKKKKPLCITANLPYIKDNDHENMSTGTVLYEPNMALYGWAETGFELYEKLIEQCLVLKKEYSQIDLYIEIGFDQKEIAENFLKRKDLDFEFYKDSATIERVVTIHF